MTLHAERTLRTDLFFADTIELVKQSLAGLQAQLVSLDAEQGLITATIASNVGLPGETLRVSVQEDLEKGCHVTVRSESDPGATTDWGANQANVDAFAQQMIYRLGASHSGSVVQPTPPTPPPQPPQQPLPPHPAPPPPVPVQPYAPRPAKDRSIALILELLPGLFGFLGFGWIYAGNTSAGVAWLVGFLLWTICAVLIDVVSGGLGCFCTLPVSIVVLAISATQLNKYTKNHPELFGP